MVSFVSIFYHLYIISSLFQPSTTLDITLSFIRQVQHKITIIISEQQVQNGRTRRIDIPLTILKSRNGPQLIFRTILDIGCLLLRVFVLLCVLLVISFVEFAQDYRRSITQHDSKTNTIRKANDIKKEVPSPSTSTVPSTTIKLEDSPNLLPTPPSEICDNIVPIASLPMNYHAPIIEDNDDDTAVTPAPSEPTPPDQKVESTTKQQQQQQQTTLIDTNNNNNANSDNNNNDDKDVHHHSSHQNEFISQPEHLPNDKLVPTMNADNKNDDMGHMKDQPTTTTNTTTTKSELVLSPPPPTSSSSTPSPKLSSSSSVSLSSQKYHKTSDELAVFAEQRAVVSEMPDHAPTPSPTLSITHTHDNNNNSTKTISSTQDDHENPAAPYLPPPLSPSGSLSSSLSTLAHTHSHHNNHNNSQQQNKPPVPSHPPLPTHNSTSRLHHAYIEKQQQQQQQHEQQHQEHKIDPVASLPRPYSSYSSRTHHSETPPTTNNSPPLPQPQGSSLSMKLNKLKKPGRRLSQLFKKKNKNKAEQ